MTNVPASIRRGVKHLAPIIEARRKQLASDERDTSWVDDLVGWSHCRCEDSSLPF